MDLRMVPNEQDIRDELVQVLRQKLHIQEAENTALKERISELEQEVEVDNKLLSERERLMKSIPECPEHGYGCVPGAIKAVHGLQAENAALRELLGEVLPILEARRDGLVQGYESWQIHPGRERLNDKIARIRAILEVKP